MARSTGAEHQANDQSQAPGAHVHMLMLHRVLDARTHGQANAETLVAPPCLPSHQYRLLSRNPPCDQVGGTSGESANDESLQGAAKCGGSSETGFDEAENKERSKSDGNRKQ